MPCDLTLLSPTQHEESSVDNTTLSDTWERFAQYAVGAQLGSARKR